MILKIKAAIISASDALCLLASFILSYLFRFDFNLLHKINLLHASHILGVSFAIYAAMFLAFKMQRIIWRYASIPELVRIVKSVACGFVISAALIYSIFGFHYVPISILPLQAVFYLGLLVTSRAFYRLYRLSADDEVVSKRVLLIGAGQAAEGIIRDMLRHKERGFLPVGLLDDDKSLHNRSLHAVKVIGSTDQFEQCLIQSNPDLVVFAIPSLSSKTLLNRVFDVCKKKNLPLRVLPGLSHLTQGRVNIDALKQVEIEDLLGREPVKVVNHQLIASLAGKTVLVTGAGGSIGSELCRQIAVNRPKTLVLVDNCEYNLYTCHAQLAAKFPAFDIKLSLADISRKQELGYCFELNKPHIVFHAAAFKHVPMLETQIYKAVKNNVLATQQLADIADSYNVEAFVLISTDKAVNPTNIMGMTKRLGEIYCQTKNKASKTRYITVRFGNVLGSNGSVLPLFRKQLAKGGPLTVTDPAMTRYFMMIPESVTLVLQSFLLGKGGEIFVLEMGEPVKIVDLAEKLISLSGREPYTQIDIQFTGVRPGEKLYEEIFHASEEMAKTKNDKILISKTRDYDRAKISEIYNKIDLACKSYDKDMLLSLMLELVPEYNGEHAKTKKPAFFSEDSASKLKEKRQDALAV